MVLRDIITMENITDDELWDLCSEYEAVKSMNEKKSKRLRNEDEIINWELHRIYWEDSQNLK